MSISILNKISGFASKSPSRARSQFEERAFENIVRAIRAGLAKPNLAGDVETASIPMPKEHIVQIVLESDARRDWSHLRKGSKNSAVYNRDVNLRFEIDDGDEGVQQEHFQASWANRHPDPDATGYYCHLYYGSSLIERFILVAIDGARAMLPIPREGLNPVSPDKIRRLDYKAAQIHDSLNTLDEYIRRSSLSLADS